MKSTLSCSRALGARVVLACVAVVLAACGGGSKGGDSAGLSYSGARDQATLSADNAERVIGAINGSYFGQSGSSVSPQRSATALTPASARAAARTVVRQTVRRAERVTIAAQQSINLPVDGECGGKAIYQGTYDDISGVFSGSTVFNGFCEGGQIIDGSMRISGTIELPIVIFPSFVTLTMSYDLITIKIGTDVIALSGTTTSTRLPVGTDGFDFIEEMVETLNVRKNNLPVVRVEGFTTRVAENAPVMGTDTIRFVSGRVYSPSDGYVDVSSTSNFLIRHVDKYPYAGVLVAVGKVAPGGVGPSRAVVTANSDALTFRLQVDANGDGVNEVDQVRNWADF